jgi:hypothetical protein
MEATLKPKILETFEEIATRYKKLGKLQDAEIEAHMTSEELSQSQDRRYKKLKNETIELVKSLRLNNNRIEALVEQGRAEWASRSCAAQGVGGKNRRGACCWACLRRRDARLGRG